jgi:hypothetical protein
MYYGTTYLHNNPFIATIQLLLWLLFRPSAWIAMVAHIDPALPADFALSKLRLEQWRHPTLLRLLGLIYVIGPVVIGIIVGLWLWLTNEDIITIVRGIIYVVTLSFVGGLTSGITVSVAFSHVAGMISGLLVGLFFGMPDEAWYRAAILSSVFAVSLASSVLVPFATQSSQSQAIQKVDSLLISFFVIVASGAIVVSGVILLASLTVVYYTMLLFDTVDLTILDPQMIGLGVGTGLAFGLYTRRWIWAGILVLVVGITMSIVISWPISDGETHTTSLDILINSLLGGLANGLLFALLFALPYWLARYIANPWTGIMAGLLGSGGVYVVFFMLRQPNNPILLLSIIALSLGLSQRWWRKTLHTISRQVAETTSDEKIDNPYTNVPLTIRNKNLFVGRTEVSARIELLIQNPHSPPILLYGQRRMGKTSLLNVLSELLPDSYVPLFVDFQGPVALAADHSSFFYSFSRALIRSARDNCQLTLPPISREALQSDPFLVFDEWLDSVEDSVEGRTVLLTFDEFEALEGVFQNGHLNKDFVLGLFRHIIQHRQCFKILIAGVHQLDIFPDWASYLINAETVHLSYLQEKEAKQLIEKPVKNSLRYTPEATQRILALTRCHPALVQFLCKEIILLKNEQEPRARHSVQKEDVEVGVSHTLKSGKAYFTHMARRSKTETALLHLLAAQGEGAVISLEVLAQQCAQEQINKILSSLVQCELIESTDGGYRFQVELIRRWFTSTTD